MAKPLAETMDFYLLFRMLEQADKDSIITARDGGTEADVVTILEGWKTGHSDADIRAQCEVVLDAIAE